MSDTRLWGALWLGMAATCVSAMAADGPSRNGSATVPAASLAAEGGSAPSAAAAGPITRAILEYAAAATGGGEIIQVQAVDLPSLGQPLDALSGVGSGGGQVESQLNLASLSRLIDTASGGAGNLVDSAPSPSVLQGSVVPVYAPTDVGSVLLEAPNMTSVTAQQRNPVAFDPHIRGFRRSQIYAQSDGQYWSPVRLDLDSMLSKIDPSFIQNTTVISGPYGLRYGPGFAFIDVQTTGTPRYQSGYESHARVGFDVRGNGGQTSGAGSVYGGNQNWGYRVHYGDRRGSDYQAGNGELIPSSYNNRTWIGEIGFNLSENARAEFRYHRLDQTDTEYALQFFDVDYLGTDAWSGSVIYDDPCQTITHSRFDVWVNTTRFNGDNLNISKRPVRERVEAALATALVVPPGSVAFAGNTAGDRSLGGARAVATLGDDEWVQWSIGTDFRYDDQAIIENFTIDDAVTGNPLVPAFSTNLPKSRKLGVGIFNELHMPVRDRWDAYLGGRIDFVKTDALDEDLNNFTATDLSQTDALYAFYLTNNFQLTEASQLRLAFGHAQRAATLVERYSDGLFLGIIQNGFSRVIGNPQLDKERLWQFDVALYQDYENFRGHARYYSSWVLDFITYEGNDILDLADARLLRHVNTDLVTMNGVELYGEALMTEMLTFFAAMQYVQATDQGIDRPLWGISPLEGRGGIRLHDANGGQYWAVEMGMRAVARQGRVGLIRTAGVPDQFLAIEQATPNFITANLRGYLNYTENLSFVGGIDNMFDTNYIEHLDLRLQPQNGVFPALFAFSPGFTFYSGIQWVR